MATKPNVRVTVGENEPIEKALRKFKRLCEKAGIKKVKSRRYYEKPSESRRREVRKAERNRRKQTRKDQESETRNKRSKGRGWMFNHPKLSENSD